MIDVVVENLNYEKVGMPTPTKIDDTSHLHIIEHLNGPLALIINLRVISCIEKQSVPNSS